jgi:hypothetical protein
MNKTLFLAAACLSLVACSVQYDWKREGVSADTRNADTMACRKEMSRYGGNDARDVFDACMKSKGYEKEASYGL